MVLFVVPVYNESQNIVTLLNKTGEKMKNDKFPYRIFIVNDGSTDNTLEVLEPLKDRLPIEILSYYPNKGVGEAFRVGLRRAVSVAAVGDIIITKEADNTSDLNILEKLITRIKEGNDVALASCYARDGAVENTTLFRLILSKTANKIIKLLLPLKNVNTYSSFYRAYNADTLKQMHNTYGDRLIEENGFECMVELLIKFSLNKKYKIVEVPMVLDGSKRSGKSKMRILKTTLGFLRVIFKYGIAYRIKGILKR